VIVTYTGTGNGSFWLIMNVTRMELPPAVNLSDPTEIDTDAMTLTWTEYAGTDFDSYAIYMSRDPDVLGDRIATIRDVNTTTYRVTGLLAGTTYYFVVRVYNSYGLYSDSNQVSGTTRTTGVVYDITLSVTVSDKKPKEGDKVTITARITNIGTTDSVVVVTFAVDGKLVHTMTMIIPVGATNMTSYVWKSKEGKHTITVNATFTGGYQEETITIDVEKKKGGIPGFEPVLVGAAAAAAIFLMRRRRW
jgi:chitodextrinase